MILRIYCICTF